MSAMGPTERNENMSTNDNSPMIVVEIPHQTRPRVYAVESLDALRDLANDELHAMSETRSEQEIVARFASSVRVVRDDGNSTDGDECYDVELIEGASVHDCARVLGDDLHACMVARNYAEAAQWYEHGWDDSRTDRGHGWLGARDGIAREMLALGWVARCAECGEPARHGNECSYCAVLAAAAEEDARDEVQP